MAPHCADPDALPRESASPMSNPALSTLPATRVGLLQAAVMVLGLKLVALAIDPSVRLFLGDSGTYLHTAITDWIPPDRSFLYGWLIAATAVATQSVYSLLTVQTLFGAVSALLLYAWLAYGLRLRPVLALAAAGLFALEPTQIFYERMMMAEATGFLSLALFFCAVSLYLVSGHWRWILVYALLGVMAVAFRISMLAVVLALSALAPFLRLACAPAVDRGRPLLAALRVCMHLAVSLTCTAGAHGYYKQWYGELAGVAPAYTASAGIFRLGLVAPLVEVEHLRNSGVPPEALDQVTIDRHDHRTREAQIWSAGGLVDVLRRHTHDPDRAARKISIKAARENPVGLARIGLLTVADYFDPALAEIRLQDDIGRRTLHPSLLEALRKHLRYDAAGIAETDSPATRWFELGRWWLTACLMLLAPMAAITLAFGWRSGRRELRLLLALASLGLVAAHVLFSHIVSFRYLHPLPWFMLANLALLLDLWITRRRMAGGGRPSSAS